MSKNRSDRTAITMATSILLILMLLPRGGRAPRQSYWSGEDKRLLSFT
ncbi:MAG TPA: hypothetical protein VJ643_07755 [Nitrososphaera sp.]|nr:hypothetical protein [Nitrososphaera sp.]